MKNITMDVFEFIAKMLHFLPDYHEKSIRYYGIYVRPAKKNNAIQLKCSWSSAIERAFDIKPQTEELIHPPEDQSVPENL